VENLAPWKRALAEFSAVFLLASIGLMTVATAITAGAYGLFELSIAFGFAITVMVVVSGAVSGAHFNPAIAAAQKWPLSIVNLPTAALAQAFATLILAIVVFAAVDTRNSFAPNLSLFALFIGFIIAFIIMVEAPLTMACINPARDLGPRIAILMLGWGSRRVPRCGTAMVGVDRGPHPRRIGRWRRLVLHLRQVPDATSRGPGGRWSPGRPTGDPDARW
jgi:glycerol uptake facilitator-like aquaporin